jgi:hypothetical protein
MSNSSPDSLEPAAADAYRVPRSRLDEVFNNSDPLPPVRVGSAEVISVEGDTATVLISDEIVSGIVYQGDPPEEGEWIQIESHGDLMTSPPVFDVDRFLEGDSSVAPHIVDDSDPGMPEAVEVQIAGSMRELEAWNFIDPDIPAWQKTALTAGVGLHITQGATALVARNLVPNPSVEGTTGWATNTLFGSSTECAVEYSTERAHTGLHSAKATWPNLLPGNTQSAMIIYCSTDIPPKTKVTLSGWIYVPAGSPDVYLSVAFFDGSTPVTERDAWVYREVQMTTPDEANPRQYFVGLQCLAPVAGTTAYLDDVMFRLGWDPLPGGVTYFDGDTTDSEADDVYLWDGAPGQSTSSHFSRVAGNVLINRNLVTSPAFDVDSNADGVADGWWAANSGTNGTITRSISAGAQRIAASAQGSTQSDTVGVFHQGMPVVPEQAHYARVDVSAVTLPAGHEVMMLVQLLDQSGAIVDALGTTRVTAGLLEAIVTPPANAATAVMVLVIRGTATGPGGTAAAVAASFDQAMMTQSATPVAYFDGSTVGSTKKVFQWDGERNNSSSSWFDMTIAATPSGGTGELWNSYPFDVEPGDALTFTATASMVATPPATMEAVVCWAAETIDPLPDAPESVVLAYPVAVSVGGDNVLMTASITVPAEVTTPSGDIVPRRGRVGLRFTGGI